MPHAIPLHAVLYLEAEDGYLSGTDVAHRVASSFPSAKIDWDRAQKWIDSRVAEAEQEGASEAHVESIRSEFEGDLVYLSVPVEDAKANLVCGYANTLAASLGDSFQISSEPYDVKSLMQGAAQLSRALGCDFFLERDHYPRVTSERSSCASIEPFIRQRLFCSEANNEELLELRPVDDWGEELRNSFVASHDQDQDQSVADALQIPDIDPTFDTLDSYASGVISDLQTISPVQRVWRVNAQHFPYMVSFAIDHGQWHTWIHVGHTG